MPYTLAEYYGGAYDEDATEDAIARVADPRPPGIMLERFRALGIGERDVVLDLGCGHGQYTRQIVAAIGCRVVALDFSPQSAAETRAGLDAAQAPHVVVAQAMAEALPLRAESLRAIWCRDMLYHVDLARTMRECARALASGGHMLVYHSFATDALEPLEADLVLGSSIVRRENMAPAFFEECARDAGFAVVERDEIGGQWREHLESAGEGNSTAKLLRASRLIRGREVLTAKLGETGYVTALADQLWGVYQMIGKLCPTIYLLRREG